MNTQSLEAVGLTSPQAGAYALLIELGQVKPPEVATRLQITRTNAYKLLDKLVELKLANKLEIDKKFVYEPSNPIALTSLTAQYRAEAVAREEAANTLLHELLEKYYKHANKPNVKVTTGRQAVVQAYRKQINLREDVYFIHTKADIPLMGFDTMHEIRIAPGRFGNKRYGVMAKPDKGPINYKQHERSKLEVTWAPSGLYSAPVEWSVTKSSLLIVVYATEPHAIFITDPLVAEAFLQLWKIIAGSLNPV